MLVDSPDLNDRAVLVLRFNSLASLLDHGAQSGFRVDVARPSLETLLVPLNYGWMICQSFPPDLFSQSV